MASVLRQDQELGHLMRRGEAHRLRGAEHLTMPRLPSCDPREAQFWRSKRFASPGRLYPSQTPNSSCIATSPAEQQETDALWDQVDRALGEPE
jgi:hypothetical protein